MISFQENSFTIIVPAPVLPTEDWLQTVEELHDMLKCLDVDMIAGKNYTAVLHLLSAMMPDFEMAQRMVDCQQAG